MAVKLKPGLALACHRTASHNTQRRDTSSWRNSLNGTPACPTSLTPGSDLSWPAWQLMLDSPGLADELSVSYANPSPLAAAAKNAGTAQPCLGAALVAGGMAAAVVQHTANVGIEHQTCGAPCGCTKWWLLGPGAHLVRRFCCFLS